MHAQILLLLLLNWVRATPDRPFMSSKSLNQTRLKGQYIPALTTVVVFVSVAPVASASCGRGNRRAVGTNQLGHVNRQSRNCLRREVRSDDGSEKCQLAVKSAEAAGSIRMFSLCVIGHW